MITIARHETTSTPPWNCSRIIYSPLCSPLTKLSLLVWCLANTFEHKHIQNSSALLFERGDTVHRRPWDWPLFFGAGGWAFCHLASLSDPRPAAPTQLGAKSTELQDETPGNNFPETFSDYQITSGELDRLCLFVWCLTHTFKYKHIQNSSALLFERGMTRSIVPLLSPWASKRSNAKSFKDANSSRALRVKSFLFTNKGRSHCLDGKSLRLASVATLANQAKVLQVASIDKLYSSRASAPGSSPTGSY